MPVPPHSRPNNIKIELGHVASEVHVDWLSPDKRLAAAYANTTDTTEAGAYGVSLAAVELEAGLVAVQRAETLSGADYYVAPQGADPDDLEEALRLEVSGTETAGRGVCDRRLRQKVEQTQRASHSNPALASVVSFCDRVVLVSDVIAP
jgi:hypothetical protein